MFTEVILSQRFPKHMGIFDYAVPPALEGKVQLGSMVTIPFRSQFREGIVIRIKTQGISGKHIKPIKEIIPGTAVLTTQQLTLAEWMCGYYHVSLGTIIKSMLPPLPPKRIHLHQPRLTPSTTPLPANQQRILQQRFTPRGRSELAIPRTYQDYTDVYRSLCAEKLGMTLVISPTIEKIAELAALVPTARHQDVVMVHGLLGNNELHACWNEIKQNPNAIIIGTKSAIFLPLHSVRRIIIDEEENNNHKQSDQNPRYDVRTLAVQCCQIYRTQLVSISAAPQVTTFSDIPEPQHYYLQAHGKSLIAPKIIDMRDERKRKNFSLLSDTLHQAITQALSAHTNILLLINKRGSANALMCRDCGTTVRCPTCGHAYTYHEQPRGLYCHHCLTRADVATFCASCHGVNLRTIGLGTQSVESFIKKNFPYATMSRVDSDTTQEKKPLTANIVIGTSTAIPLIPQFNPGLIGMIDADTFLYLPDYRSVERTWQLIQSLAWFPSPLIIQTFNPDHQVFQLSAARNLIAFYETELQSRKKMGYPPFGSLIRLLYRHRDKKDTLTEAKRLYRILNNQPLEVSLVTPLKPFQHAHWHMYIVIRFDRENPPAIIDAVLRAIPDTWIIDRDPTSLL